MVSLYSLFLNYKRFRFLTGGESEVRLVMVVHYQQRIILVFYQRQYSRISSNLITQNHWNKPGWPVIKMCRNVVDVDWAMRKILKEKWEKFWFVIHQRMSMIREYFMCSSRESSTLNSIQNFSVKFMNELMNFLLRTRGIVSILWSWKIGLHPFVFDWIKQVEQKEPRGRKVFVLSV